MKKLILVLFGLTTLNTYADVTQGALQNNPALCAYGYNPNCGGNAGGYTPQVRVEHITINHPPKFGALAYSTKKAIFAGAINQNSQSEAEREALKSCRQASGSKDCKVVAEVRNGCVAAAEGRLGRNGFITTPAASATAEETEAKALALCKAEGAKDCKILAYAGCSFPY